MAPHILVTRAVAVLKAVSAKKDASSKKADDLTGHLCCAELHCYRKPAVSSLRTVST